MSSYKIYSLPYFAPTYLNTYSSKVFQFVKLSLNNFNITYFGFKKTNREISTAGGEIIYLFFQIFIIQTSFGQRPRQCLNKLKKEM